MKQSMKTSLERHYQFFLTTMMALGFMTCHVSVSGAADVRLALQNQYAAFDVASSGVSNKAWCMNGSALESNKGDTVERFLNYTEEQVKKKLEAYLAAHPSLDVKTTDLLILDMEHPVHPSRIGSYSDDPVRQKKIIEAFKMRIRIARERFPNAKLSMFGIIRAQARGNPEARGFKEMMEGYRRAGELGMYDKLDYISPVLYLRQGARDPGYQLLEKYTSMGIKYSKSLETSDGKSKPLAPFLGLKVYNKRSRNDRECVPIEATKKQLEILLNDSDVKIVVYWAARADSETSEEFCNIKQFFEQLKPLISKVR